MSTYDKFAKKYSDSMGEEGDYYHKKYIDPAIYSIIGNPKGKIIYDIGCGNGYMARYFAKKGAKVYASDISEKLIKIAERKSKRLDITYHTHDAIDFSKYKSSFFDFVVMNMSIHYIEDLGKLFKGISRVLKPKGVFAFSTSHFLRPDYPYSDWVLGKLDNKETAFVTLTGYLETRKDMVTSWWDKKTKLPIISRPLNEYVNSLAKHNLYLYKVIEPESPEFGKRFPEKLRESHHIPTYMIFGAKKLG
jgi:ubiquinone/menaquinone biosynthesis C-methylase UbiE